MANSDMRDEAIDEDDFHWPFYLYMYTSYTDIQSYAQYSYNKLHNKSMDGNIFEAIKQKNNLGIIGNDTRIKKNNG